MKQRFVRVAMASVLAASLSPAFSTFAGSRDLPDGAQFTAGGGTPRVQFWSDDIVRVTCVNGVPVTIPLVGDDTTKILTLGERTGEFPGMLKECIFPVNLVKDRHGNGIAIVEI